MSSFFEPSDFSLTRDEDGTLRLHQHGQSTRLAAPRRAMPLSQPESFIALWEENGGELGWVSDVSALDDASREVLEEALQKAYRIERIVRVLKTEKEVLSGQTRWLVEIAAEKNANLNDAEDDGNDAEDDVSPDSEAAAKDGVASTREPKLLRVFSEKDKDKDDETPGVIERIKRKRRAASADDETLFGGLSISESEERQFLIGGQEDVQTARYPHIFIVDTDRNRYEILDCEALDVESRRAAERFF